MRFFSRRTLLDRYFRNPHVISDSRLFTSQSHPALGALFAIMLLAVPFSASASIIQWKLTGTIPPGEHCGFGPLGQMDCFPLRGGNVMGTLTVDTSLPSSPIVDYNITTESSEVAPFGFPFGIFEGYTYSPISSQYSPISSQLTSSSNSMRFEFFTPYSPSPYGEKRILFLDFTTPINQLTPSIGFGALEERRFLIGEPLMRSFSGQLSLVSVPLPASFILFTTGLLGIVGALRRGRGAGGAAGR